MLRALELENFKAFGERTRIEFAPITLIFGENSAGKTCVLQALNLLKQTRESRSRGALLLPRAEDGIVDLGSYTELLFDHDLNRQLCIRLELDVGSNQDLRGLLFKDPHGRTAEAVALELTFARPTCEHEVKLDCLRVFGLTPLRELARNNAPSGRIATELRFVAGNPAFKDGTHLQARLTVTANILSAQDRNLGARVRDVDTSSR